MDFLVEYTPMVSERQFTEIKSIKRLGCPKGGVAPYIIILAICAVVLVAIGVGIFLKKRKIYSTISTEDCEHVSKPSVEENA